MQAFQTLELLRQARVLATVREPDTDHAFRAACACLEAGMSCIEVSMAVPFACDVMESLARQPGVLVGAGGVLDAPAAALALQSGARFVRSPGVVPEVLALAARHGAVGIAGAWTPGEVLTALNAGADVISVLSTGPAALAHLEALSWTYPQALFLPELTQFPDDVQRWMQPQVLALALGGRRTLGTQDGDCEQVGRRALAARRAA